MWKLEQSNLHAPIAFRAEPPNHKDFALLSLLNLSDVSTSSKTSYTVIEFNFNKSLIDRQLIDTNLIIGCRPLSVYGISPYVATTIDNIKTENYWLSNIDFFLQDSIETFYVVTQTQEDIYATFEYNITNITNVANLYPFLESNTEIESIYYQNSTYANKSLVTSDFIRNASYTNQTIVTIIYKSKIFGGDSIVLNNLIETDTLPAKLFEHSISNWYSIDVLRNDGDYFYRIPNLDKFFSRGFVLNSTHGLIINT